MSTTKLTVSEKKRFDTIQDILIGWYKKNRRMFSWRKNIRDPYQVLVCEVMAQQTQASRIEEFLPRFLEQFPTVKALASAKQSEVIRAWQGLGYNRRALNLHKVAKELLEKDFPKKEEELLTLPGIGKYTARALLIFAFNKPVATVDINIQRLLSRLYKKMADTDSMLPAKNIFDLGENILPKRQSRLWHEAMMDFGATICTKRNPKCGTCPLFHECKSGTTFIEISSLPKKRTKSSEPRYFGAPKRIWRGRILKIISSNNSVSESAILGTLQDSFPKSEFTEFAKSLLADLVGEGFCAKKNKKYVLND